ncbi:hypothetical protein [Actinomadura sp. NTSP31]|uniref:hypothetical protein n=1 Tax=Actinomadura sp. NTSP31 TaxID=1735447 RepID=UPI0035C25CEE
MVRVYLLLVSREAREPVPPVGLRATRRAVREAFPVPQDVIAAVEWSAPDGQVAMFGWSNEPGHELLPETVVQGAGHRLGYCGYLAEPKRDGDLLLTEPDLGAAVSPVA